MNTVAKLHTDLTPAQLGLVRKTVAKDCNDQEFDLFAAVARRAGLDPLRKQITAVIHNKGSETKRQLTIITTIDGFRVIAHRQGDYRPMDSAPLVQADETRKGPLNPLGLVRAEVRVWKRFGSEWHPIVGEAYWDEFAPLKDEWVNNQKTGRKVLSDTWERMPRLMLAKCAEAQALRRGWPDDMSGLYTEEEMERTITIDATASEIVEHHAEQQRQKLLGGSEAVMLCTAIGEPLERVERGRVIDRLFELYRNADEPEWIEWFRKTNAEALKQVWAWMPGDALEAKRFAEQRVAGMREGGI